VPRYARDDVPRFARDDAPRYARDEVRENTSSRGVFGAAIHSLRSSGHNPRNQVQKGLFQMVRPLKNHSGKAHGHFEGRSVADYMSSSK